MNERIKQLADQARIKDHWSIDEGRYLTNYLNEQKFAELIVGECEQMSLKNSHRNDDMGAIIARQIKEHFGVKE